MIPPDRSKPLTPEAWKWLFVEDLLEYHPDKGRRFAERIANFWYVAWADMEPERAVYRWRLENGYLTPPPPEPSPRQRGADRGMGRQNAEHTEQVIDQAMRRPVRKGKIPPSK